MRYRKSPVQIAKHKSVQWLRNNSVATYPQQDKITLLQLASFEESITGKIVYPWSPDYNTDRKDFNDVYPAFPVMIVYAATWEDVRLTLAMAHQSNVWMVVRSGGHSIAGFSVCDGIVLDMSAMKNIYIDVSRQTALIEAGCTFGDIYPRVEFYNLHLPGGGCPTVSVSGFMQGGGYSLTSRNYGINCDCVLEFTMMLANGKIIVANPNQNQDLFWAVRGGTGNNFGVLLSIKYQLFPLTGMYGRQITWSIDDNKSNAALALYTIQNKYLQGNNYPNLGIETILTTDATDNKKKVFFCGGWIGTQQAFDAVLKPLLDIPGAKVTLNEYGRYSKVNNDLLESCPVLPEDIKAYSRSIYIERLLSVADWTNILTYFQTAPNQYTMVDMEGYGGKIGTVEESNCAFIHRKVTMDFFCDAFFNQQTNDQKKNEDWLNAFMRFMEQYGNGHSYQNYPNRDQANYKWAYWGRYYNLLVAIKKKYDPNNFFHYMQSIGALIGPEYESQQERPISTDNPMHYETY